MKERAAPSVYIVAMMGLLVGLFSLIWAYTNFERGYFLSGAYGAWRAVIQNTQTCQTTDMAIIGSSQASVGFLPRTLGLPVKNYALLASTPLEGYFEAKALYRCPSPPKVFVVSFSGFDFVSQEWFWDRAASYDFLTFNDLQDVAQTSAALHSKSLYHGAFGSEPPPAMKNWLYAHHFPPYDFASLLAAKVIKRKADNDRFTAETLANDGEHLFRPGDCAREPGLEADKPHFEPNPLNVEYFNRLLALLVAHHAKVIFMPPPMSDLTFKRLSQHYSQDYGAFFDQMRARYPQVKFLQPLFPVADKCLFADPSHLNEKGVDAFSRSAGKRLGRTLDQWDQPTAPAS